MPDQTARLRDERLRELRDNENVCTNKGERAMAAELLELRQRLAELEAERERVVALAERWESATELGTGTGTPSIITRAFAAEVRAALEGTRSV
ncbi:hypothetical protein OG874_00195 [Nocardia sp. NBC_00565]|uniref:hypothetical protein n=1 Tax=Nocardia sp. NBC_00565 TaxID=2975993 RepID=UPI002E7FF956|nr:hypothetical protein [Nocardia sp. NBC_00565]WUC03674.1 hypothetical protein OG874_00195 [Nocardia sp. NBC_00565]